MAAAIRPALQCACKSVSAQLKKIQFIASSNVKLQVQSIYLASVRVYKTRHGKQTDYDPRKNTQYPYAPGDPLQEEAIRNLREESALSALKEKDQKANQKKKDKILKKNTLFETPSGLKYEKIQEGDIRLGRTILPSKSKQPGRDTETIFLEGQRLIKDALLLGAQAKSLYFCDPEVLNRFPVELLQGVDLYKILYRDMKTWSDTVTPAGLIGVFKKPSQGEAISPIADPLPITLIFDSVKDPGNAGTLIRTAAAVGCKRILSTRGSVNMWESKVLRSAMGGHFSLPIYTGLSWVDIPNYLDEGTQVFLASSRPADTLARAFDGHLKSEDVERVMDAGELTDSDSETDSDVDSEVKDKKLLHREFHAEKRAYSFHKVPLTVFDYSKIQVTASQQQNIAVDDKDLGSVTLVVGRETEGLSALAKQFAYSHYGQYITIPMSEAVESLNTGIAGSITLYELRKKILLLRQGQFAKE